MVKLPSDIRSMYTDAYKLHESFCDMGNDTEAWTKFHKACVEICNLHNSHPLMNALSVAVNDQLERERKRDADGP